MVVLGTHGCQVLLSLGADWRLGIAFQAPCSALFNGRQREDVAPEPVPSLRRGDPAGEVSAAPQARTAGTRASGRGQGHLGGPLFPEGHVSTDTATHWFLLKTDLGYLKGSVMVAERQREIGRDEGGLTSAGSLSSWPQ